MPQQDPDTVSIICPSFNEEDYIGECLDSLLAQDYPTELVEILIVDGRSTDRTREIVTEYSQRHPQIQLLDNPAKIVPNAMNIGLKKAQGTYIVRVDCHALYEPDYVSQCVRLLAAGRAENVGGNQTAEGRDWVSKAIALATSSRFGVGNAHYKYATEERYVDTVYLGAWRRDTLESLGGYDEDFTVNQDYELNYRLREAGGRILLSPAIRCTYFVRPSIRKLAKQYYRYGKWKVQTLEKHPSSLVWRQTVAPAFVVGLAASAVTAPVAPPIAGIIPGTYAMANLAVSGRIAMREGLVYLPILPVVFSTIHVAWGTGFCVGVVRSAARPTPTVVPVPA